MKVTDVKFNPVDAGNLLAFATVTFDDAVTVKGFRVLEGDDGPFVGCPSEKGKDGKYYPIVTFSKKTFKPTLETILSFYEEFLEDEKPRKKKRKDDDDDEKPKRKRRDEDDDDEDERPKKKTRKEDDDEDERPKKKKRDKDDDEDEDEDVDIWGKRKR